MERAGRAVADEVLRRYPDARRIAAVCGGGANGGDGRIALRVLREAGRDAEETRRPRRLRTSSSTRSSAPASRASRGPRRPSAIERMNAAGAPVVAVDLPSGVDASTGEIAGAAVLADCTVTFHGAKVGLEVAPGSFHAGEVVVADIGLDRDRHGAPARVTREVLRLVPRRHAGRQQVHRGVGARARRRARADGSGLPDRRGGVPRRRRLRRRRRARRVAAGARAAPARGGQAADRGRVRGRRARRLARPRPRARRGEGGARPSLARARATFPQSSTRTVSAGSSRSNARRPPSSRRTRASSAGCSGSSRAGSPRTG